MANRNSLGVICLLSEVAAQLVASFLLASSVATLKLTPIIAINSGWHMDSRVQRRFGLNAYRMDAIYASPQFIS